MTRRSIGRGSAWYLATRLDTESLALWMEAIYEAAGLEPHNTLPAGQRNATATAR